MCCTAWWLVADFSGFYKFRTGHFLLVCTCCRMRILAITNPITASRSNRVWTRLLYIFRFRAYLPLTIFFSPFFFIHFRPTAIVLFLNICNIRSDAIVRSELVTYFYTKKPTHVPPYIMCTGCSANTACDDKSYDGFKRDWFRTGKNQYDVVLILMRHKFNIN